MTSLQGIPFPGSVLDLPVDPRYRLKYVTESIYGPPIYRKQSAPDSAPNAFKPRPLGDEKHSQLLSAIKGLSLGGSKPGQPAGPGADVRIEQQALQQVGGGQAKIQEALKESRQWRR